MCGWCGGGGMCACTMLVMDVWILGALHVGVAPALLHKCTFLCPPHPTSPLACQRVHTHTPAHSKQYKIRTNTQKAGFVRHPVALAAR